MQGIIDVFSADHGLGLIKSETRDQFIFEVTEWYSEHAPRTGAAVKFDPDRSMARLVVPLIE